MSEKKDYFKHKAKDYEKAVIRQNNIKSVADNILEKITYTKDMHIMDFGSGTGLLTSKIAPFVKAITTIDMSRAMNEVLRAKIDDYPCKVDMLEIDLSKEDIDSKFDGIISSMTIHHVEDLLALFKKLYLMLNNGGTIALADLETENGTFHSDDTGVFHFGFDKDEFLDIAKEAGFRNLEISTVSVIKKPIGDFAVFLLTGEK